MQTSDQVLLDEIVEARAPWRALVPQGAYWRIEDLRGNQAVDCLLYSAADDAERYSVQDTITHNRNIYLRPGAALVSNRGRVMAWISGTDVPRHDTLGGACSCESNTLRYGFHTKQEHSCVDNFLLASSWAKRGKRDLVANINWFMNVPVEADGTLGIVDGISGPGKFVEIRAAIDLDVIVSNCPQINNPCNGFDPTPVRRSVYRRAN